MAPNAGHDDVKRAFLDHALRFHPDRQGDLSDDARERAEFRMREINAAWEVLRNPSARARYDDELKAAAAEAKKPERVRSTSVFDNTGTGTSPGDAPPSPVRARPRVISLEPDEVADLAPAEGPSPAGARKTRWLAWGPVLIGGTVLVVVLIAAAVSSKPTGSTVKLDTVEEFGVGTCVAVVTDPAPSPGAQAAPVLLSIPCSSPHNGQVVAIEAIPRPCPAGSRAFPKPGDDKQSVCVVATE